MAMKSGKERLTMKRLATLVCGGVALAVGVVALTTGSGHSAQARSESHNNESGGLGPVDWSRPLMNAVTVPSASAASKSLAFQPAAPSSLGTPTSIQITNPQAAGASSDRSLALIYDNPSLGGRFWVLEHPAGATTSSELSAIAASCTPASGCEGTANMISLGNGVSALHLEGATEGIIWVQGGVYYDVVGPADTFTAPDATSVANATANAVSAAP